MMKILITGAAGFIGNALCRRLASQHEVVGTDVVKCPSESFRMKWLQVDLTDLIAVDGMCESYSPDVVVHCAGIAHQKAGSVSTAAYMQANSEATENIAKAAAKINPDVMFIFLSSVSVYGENISGQVVSEEYNYFPSSDYAASKMDAEKRLIALFNDKVIRNVIIVRLAPVYDREWSLNLDRRVFAPGKVAYLRFGLGVQTMSALARPNLVEFIEFLSRQWIQVNMNGRRIDTLLHRKGRIGSGNDDQERRVRIYNVCDAEPYEFKRIIQVFKRSGVRPNGPVVPVPLLPVWLATRIAGFVLTDKKEWIHSCYDKVAGDLVYSNKKMLDTGFTPVHNLESIFLRDGVL